MLETTTKFITKREHIDQSMVNRDFCFMIIIKKPSFHIEMCVVLRIIFSQNELLSFK